MFATTLDSIARMLTLPLILLVTFYGYRFIHAASEHVRKKGTRWPAIIGGAILSLAIASALTTGLVTPNAVDGQAIVLVILLALSILYLVESAVFGAIRIARYRQHWTDALRWGAWEAVGTLFSSVVALAVFQMLAFRAIMLVLTLPSG
jgi:hypothetical protein